MKTRHNKFLLSLVGVFATLLVLLLGSQPVLAVNDITCWCYYQDTKCEEYPADSSQTSCPTFCGDLGADNGYTTFNSGAGYDAQSIACEETNLGADTVCFCHYEDGDCLTYYIDSTDPNQTCGEICGVPDWGSSGIGTALFEELNEQCLEEQAAAAIAEEEADIAARAELEGEEIVEEEVPDVPYELEIQIGDVTQVNNLTDYIQQLYQFMIGAVGIVATVMIMWAGFQWVLAAGDKGKITKAREGIINALIGLVLALGSFVILNTLNPQLVGIKLPNVTRVGLSELEDLPPSSRKIPCSWKDPATASSSEYSVGEHACEGTGEAGEVCFCKFNSNCRPINSGPCAVSKMETYFGDNKNFASAICVAESDNKANVGQDCNEPDPHTEDQKSTKCTDYCHNDPEWRGFSFGMFQINIRANPILLASGGERDCRGVIDEYRSLYSSLGIFECTITDDAEWNSCMLEGINEENNKKTAAGLSEGGKYWDHWSTKVKCGFPTKN